MNTQSSIPETEPTADMPPSTSSVLLAIAIVVGCLFTLVAAFVIHTLYRSTSELERKLTEVVPRLPHAIVTFDPANLPLGDTSKGFACSARRSEIRGDNNGVIFSVDFDTALSDTNYAFIAVSENNIIRDRTRRTNGLDVLITEPQQQEFITVIAYGSTSATQPEINKAVD